MNTHRPLVRDVLTIAIASICGLALWGAQPSEAHACCSVVESSKVLATSPDGERQLVLTTTHLDCTGPERVMEAWLDVIDTSAGTRISRESILDPRAPAAARQRARLEARARRIARHRGSRALRARPALA